MYLTQYQSCVVHCRSSPYLSSCYIPSDLEPATPLDPGAVAGISVGCVLLFLLLVAICIALVVIAVVLVIRARQK